MKIFEQKFRSISSETVRFYISNSRKCNIFRKTSLGLGKFFKIFRLNIFVLRMYLQMAIRKISSSNSFAFFKKLQNVTVLEVDCHIFSRLLLVLLFQKKKLDLLNDSAVGN